MTGSQPPRRALYGRQQGRPLRPNLKKLLDAQLPRLALELPASGVLDMAALYPQPFQDIWLEIGFGGGEHLAWQLERQCAEAGSVAFLGAEYFVNGIASLLRHLAGGPGLDWLRLYQGDARDLLDVLPLQSLGRVFILFPDPWPKARHNKRRIVRLATLDRLAELMKPGAELRIATDDPGYLHWIMVRAARHPGFTWLAEGPADWRQRPADWPPTRYEQKALEQGRRPAFLRFQRRS